MSFAAGPAADLDSPSVRRPFTPVERFLLTVISWAVTVAVRLIAPTLRYSVSCEENSPRSLEQRPFVYSFWHQCIFPAVYLWRNLDIRVMSSTSFDGEFTARMIRRFGFVPVRGSSSRGAVRGLLGKGRKADTDQPSIWLAALLARTDRGNIQKLGAQPHARRIIAAVEA